MLFHRRESKRELDYCKRYQASNFFSFLYISQNNYIEEVSWAKMFKSEWLKRQDILLSFVANSFAAKVLVIVNKIILFWFLFINSGRYNNKKTGDYQERRRMGLRLFGQNSFSLHILRFLVQQNTALFSTFRPSVRHRRDISTFLDNFMI